MELINSNSLIKAKDAYRNQSYALCLELSNSLQKTDRLLCLRFKSYIILDQIDAALDTINCLFKEFPFSKYHLKSVKFLEKHVTQTKEPELLSKIVKLLTYDMPSSCLSEIMNVLNKMELEEPFPKFESNFMNQNLFNLAFYYDSQDVKEIAINLYKKFIHINREQEYSMNIQTVEAFSRLGCLHMKNQNQIESLKNFALAMEFGLKMENSDCISIINGINFYLSTHSIVSNEKSLVSLRIFGLYCKSVIHLINHEFEYGLSELMNLVSMYKSLFQNSYSMTDFQLPLHIVLLSLQYLIHYAFFETNQSKLDIFYPLIMKLREISDSTESTSIEQLKTFFTSILAVLDPKEYSNFLIGHYKILKNLKDLLEETPCKEYKLMSYLESLIELIDQNCIIIYHSNKNVDTYLPDPNIEFLTCIHFLNLFDILLKKEKFYALNDLLALRLKIEQASKNLANGFWTKKFQYLQNLIKVKLAEEYSKIGSKDNIFESIEEILPNYKSLEPFLQEKIALILIQSNRIKEVLAIIEPTLENYLNSLINQSSLSRKEYRVLYYKLFNSGQIFICLIGSCSEIFHFLINEIESRRIKCLMKRCSQICFENKSESRDYIIFSDQLYLPNKSPIEFSRKKFFEFIWKIVLFPSTSPMKNDIDTNSNLDSDILSMNLRQILSKLYLHLVRPIEEEAKLKNVQDFLSSSGESLILVTGNSILANSDPFSYILPWDYLINRHGEFLKDKIKLVHNLSFPSYLSYSIKDREETFLAIGAPALFQKIEDEDYNWPNLTSNRNFVWKSPKSLLNSGREELLQAACVAAVGDSDCLVIGEEFTKSTFIRRIQKSTFVHLTTYINREKSFIVCTPSHWHSGLKSQNVNEPVPAPSWSWLVNEEDIQMLNLNAIKLLIINGGQHTRKCKNASLQLITAFLKAGVQNILTLLWPVPNVVTKCFFQTFYDNLLEGNTIFNAHRIATLRIAQQQEFETDCFLKYTYAFHIYGYNPCQKIDLIRASHVGLENAINRSKDTILKSSIEVHKCGDKFFDIVNKVLFMFLDGEYVKTLTGKTKNLTKDSMTCYKRCIKRLESLLLILRSDSNDHEVLVLNHDLLAESLFKQFGIHRDSPECETSKADEIEVLPLIDFLQSLGYRILPYIIDQENLRKPILNNSGLLRVSTQNPPHKYLLTVLPPFDLQWVRTAKEYIESILNIARNDIDLLTKFAHFIESLDDYTNSFFGDFLTLLKEVRTQPHRAQKVNLSESWTLNKNMRYTLNHIGLKAESNRCFKYLVMTQNHKLIEDLINLCESIFRLSRKSYNFNNENRQNFNSALKTFTEIQFLAKDTHGNQTAMLRAYAESLK